MNKRFFIRFPFTRWAIGLEWYQWGKRIFIARVFQKDFFITEKNFKGYRGDFKII